MDSDSGINGAALQSFKEFTGYTNDEDARRLLEHCDWDVERAINIFFMRRGQQENGDIEQDILVEKHRRPNQPPRRISHYAARKDEHIPQGVAALDDSVQLLDYSDDIQMLEDNDEGTGAAATTALQNGKKTGDGDGGELDADFVRAPIAPVRGVVLQQTFQDTYLSGHRQREVNPIFEQYRHDRPVGPQPSSSARSNPNFEQMRHAFREAVDSHHQKQQTDRPDLGENFVVDGVQRVTGRAVAESAGGFAVAAAGAPDRHLRTLYRPPVELMFRGDWDQALQAALQKNVWLLVNVQKATEFASAVLNRDIWSDDTVREVIRTNFMFWQVYDDSSDGGRIRGYYGINTHPAIFIVDPRTGEMVQQLRAPDPISFLDSLTTFLDQNSTFEARDQSLRAMATAGKLDSSVSPSPEKQRSGTPGKKRKQQAHSGSSSGVDDNSEAGMGEEEMMRQHAKRIKRVVTISGKESDLSSNEPSTSWHVEQDEWRKWMVPEQRSVSEPGPSFVQLAVRLPDGRRERVRMWRAAPLSALFSLLHSMGFPHPDHQIVLDFPRREFALSSDNRHTTLEEAGFGSQELVHVDRLKP